jgi:hypothetical protein
MAKADAPGAKGRFSKECPLLIPIEPGDDDPESVGIFKSHAVDGVFCCRAGCHADLWPWILCPARSGAVLLLAPAAHKIIALIFRESISHKHTLMSKIDRRYSGAQRAWSHRGDRPLPGKPHPVPRQLFLFRRAGGFFQPFAIVASALRFDTGSLRAGPKLRVACYERTKR